MSETLEEAGEWEKLVPEQRRLDELYQESGSKLALYLLGEPSLGTPLCQAW